MLLSRLDQGWRGKGTYNNGADGHVTAMEHPERPRGKPAVSLLRCDGKDFFL